MGKEYILCNTLHYHIFKKQYDTIWRCNIYRELDKVMVKKNYPMTHINYIFDNIGSLYALSD